MDRRIRRVEEKGNPMREQGGIPAGWSLKRREFNPRRITLLSQSTQKQTSWELCTAYEASKEAGQAQ